MIRWRQVVQQYGCTRCGAAPGEPCRTDTGKVRYEPHQDRTALASADGWRLDEDEPPSRHGTAPRVVVLGAVLASRNGATISRVSERRRNSRPGVASIHPDMKAPAPCVAARGRLSGRPLE